MILSVPATMGAIAAYKIAAETWELALLIAVAGFFLIGWTLALGKAAQMIRYPPGRTDIAVDASKHLGLYDNRDQRQVNVIPPRAPNDTPRINGRSW